MDGFIELARDLLCEAGLSESVVFCKRQTDVPGFFRPEKQWDLIVVARNELLAVIEFKSQIGPSFGNNYNNRTEESLGSATDLWAAFREGAFKPSQRPWLGYLMLLEDAPASTRPVKPRESHYRVFDEFRDASYAKRYEILLTKLLRERLFDGACLLMSGAKAGKQGRYCEPNAELGARPFFSSLLARAVAFRDST